jgi:hypothetical protein
VNCENWEREVKANGTVKVPYCGKCIEEMKKRVKEYPRRKHDK